MLGIKSQSENTRIVYKGTDAIVKEEVIGLIEFSSIQKGEVICGVKFNASIELQEYYTPPVLEKKGDSAPEPTEEENEENEETEPAPFTPPALIRKKPEGWYRLNVKSLRVKTEGNEPSLSMAQEHIKDYLSLKGFQVVIK